MNYYEKDLDIHEPKNVVNYLNEHALLSEVNDGSLNEDVHTQKYIQEIKDYANSNGFSEMDICYSSNGYDNRFGSMYFVWDDNQLNYDAAHKLNKQILEEWWEQEKDV